MAIHSKQILNDCESRERAEQAGKDHAALYPDSLREIVLTAFRAGFCSGVNAACSGIVNELNPSQLPQSKVQQRPTTTTLVP